MPRELPDEVAFQDASAYFSEEEWKLLHDWQKELYRNVMKEIHQALISLGPIIATTVFSLRTKEKEEPMPSEKSYSEIRHCRNQSSSEVITTPDVSYRTQREDTQYLTATYDAEERERNENLRTGLPFLDTDLCLRQEDQASIFIDHLGVEVGERNTSTHRELDEGHKVVSFQIKGEEEAYYMGHQENQRTEHFSSATGEGIVRQKWTAEDAVKFTDKMSTQTVFVGEQKVNMLQRPEMAANFRSQRWAENNQKSKSKKAVAFECGFMNEMHSSLHEEPYKMEESDLDNEQECNRNTTFVKFPEKRVQNFRQLSANSKQSTSDKSTLFSNQKSCTTERQYQCNECGKCFIRKQHFIGHQRTHTGERPYQCTQCARSFSQMHNLARHQRSHIGKKPYQCIQCGKSFSRKDNLIGHQRVRHMGVRPYGCTECSKKFSQKQNLIRHLRTHM